MYGRGSWVCEGIRIVVGLVGGDIWAVEIVDRFAEGQFLIVGKGEIDAWGWIVRIGGLLSMVTIGVVMLECVMSRSMTIGIVVCRCVIKGVVLVMVVPWYSGILMRISRSAGYVVAGLVGT